MIKFLLKKWDYFVDIALVVGVILLFAFLDPFGIFIKTKIRATANMVSSIRDIGQLVTAEYYGEVISSWKEFKLTEFPVDTISLYAKETFIEIKYTLNESENKNDAVTKVRNLDIREGYYSSLYKKLIAFFADHYLKKPLKRIYDEKNEKLKGDIEKEVIHKMYKVVKNDIKKISVKNKKDEESFTAELSDYLDSQPDFLNDFYNFHSFLTKETLDKRKNRKKNIVFIGRGWVKAGFDFGKLDENNLIYDRASKIIHLYGLQPVILDYDINPWFIPERKVKGFELVDYSGDVNFEDAKDVKRQCKEKLLQQARDADIIKRALENGEEALISFFSVILDEPGIQVKLYPDPYQNQYAVIAADTLITLEEGLYINKLYLDELERIKRLGSEDLRQSSYRQLSLFIEECKELPYINKNHLFNYYSLMASEILQDTFDISKNDIDIIMQYRDTLKKDPDNDKQLITDITQNNPCWFTSGEFYIEYDNTIDLLKEELLAAYLLQSDTAGGVNVNNKDLVVLDSTTINNTEIIYYYVKETLENNKAYLNDLKYNPYYTKTDTSYLLCRDSTMKVFNKGLDSLLTKENAVITEIEKTSVTYKKQIKPIQKLTSFADAIGDRLKK